MHGWMLLFCTGFAARLPIFESLVGTEEETVVASWDETELSQAIIKAGIAQGSTRMKLEIVNQAMEVLGIIPAEETDNEPFFEESETTAATEAAVLSKMWQTRDETLVIVDRLKNQFSVSQLTRALLALRRRLTEERNERQLDWDLITGQQAEMEQIQEEEYEENLAQAADQLQWLYEVVAECALSHGHVLPSAEELEEYSGPIPFFWQDMFEKALEERSSEGICEAIERDADNDRLGFELMRTFVDLFSENSFSDTNEIP